MVLEEFQRCWPTICEEVLGGDRDRVLRWFAERGWDVIALSAERGATSFVAPGGHLVARPDSNWRVTPVITRVSSYGRAVCHRPVWER